MITRITGTIVERGPELVVVETGGIGYAVRVPATLAVGLRDGAIVTLQTHFHIREDAQELYGFSDRESRIFFEKLIGISGVGPKTAIHIMALGTVTEIKTAVAREDVAFLTSVAGIGRKIAERIVVELKEAMQKETGAAVQAAKPALQEGAEALALGRRHDAHGLISVGEEGAHAQWPLQCSQVREHLCVGQAPPPKSHINNGSCS